MSLVRYFLLCSFIVIVSSCSAGVAPVTEARAEKAATGNCPEDRKTQSAPADFQKMVNPKTGSAQAASRGEELFQKTAKPFTCATCHGAKGDGIGEAGFESTPPARNFTCADTMSKIKDGQLFWIIQNGSPKTSMPPFKGSLGENDIWDLVTYIRTLGN